MSAEKQTKHEITIAEMITRRRNRLINRQEFWALVRRIILVGAAAWVLLAQVFLIMQVKGQDMFPAIKDGDLAIVYRLHEDYAKGDVVAYQVNGERRIGRIAARGTDVVSMDSTGTLIVNGTVQSGEILYPTYAKENVTYPYRVPADSLFVLGDYRTQAMDSRDWAAIPLSDIEGKVITILRRRGL